jgi:hypothetical protein
VRPRRAHAVTTTSTLSSSCTSSRTSCARSGSVVLSDTPGGYPGRRQARSTALPGWLTHAQASPHPRRRRGKSPCDVAHGVLSCPRRFWDRCQGPGGPLRGQENSVPKLPWAREHRVQHFFPMEGSRSSHTHAEHSMALQTSAASSRPTQGSCPDGRW